MKEERVWPYVLPFPLEAEKRRLIWSILQSRVGMSLLMRVKADGRTYQQELIREMPYSNKSIIEYLKRMVSAGMLECGMERVATEKRRIWVKWYAPTKLGKWFILFLKPPGEIPPDLARKTIKELFQVYSSSIVKVCERYGLTIDAFHRLLNEQYLQEVTERAPKTRPEVVVYGSAALDIYGFMERLPEPEESTYIQEIGRYPGGMGANVAVALARLGVPTAFVGKIGSDPAGRLMLDNLRKNNVDVSHVIPTRLVSLQTWILTDREGKRRLLTLGSPNAAMSLASPIEMDWDATKKSRIVYIGEVFLEVAPMLASFAKSQGKTVIYRPGIHYLRLGFEKIHSLLENTNIFILNRVGWAVLRDSSKERMETAGDLLKRGPNVIIVTEGPDGCTVYTREEGFNMPVPHDLQARFEALDPTGAGDSFTAGVIKGLLEGWGLKKAISYGQVAAAITCSRMGATPAFPTSEEVEGVFKSIKRRGM
ncbi:MAG: carbohydrate kinase family protein [Candidatus Bathyarchaeia archaeon]